MCRDDGTNGGTIDVARLGAIEIDRLASGDQGSDELPVDSRRGARGELPWCPDYRALPFTWLTIQDELHEYHLVLGNRTPD